MGVGRSAVIAISLAAAAATAAAVAASLVTAAATAVHVVPYTQVDGFQGIFREGDCKGDEEKKASQLYDSSSSSSGPSSCSCCFVCGCCLFCRCCCCSCCRGALLGLVFFLLLFLRGVLTVNPRLHAIFRTAHERRKHQHAESPPAEHKYKKREKDRQ